MFKRAFPHAAVKYMGVVYPRFQRIFQALTCIDGYIHYERPDKGKRMKEYFAFRREWRGKIDLLVDTQRRWETSFWLKMLKPRYMLSASPLLSDWPMPVMAYKQMHIMEQMVTLAARLGIKDIRDDDYRFTVPEEFTGNARIMLGGRSGKIAALLPSCGMEFKNWLPEYFAKIGDLFANQGYMTIILGSPKELELFRQIASRMRQPPVIPAERDPAFAAELMNDAAILQHCDIAVGNDSGGMHLASCLGCLSATIFGPTTPRKFAPVGPNNIIFYKQLPCSPCRFVCSRKVHKECLVSITPDEVFKACMAEMGQKERV